MENANGDCAADLVMQGENMLHHLVSTLPLELRLFPSRLRNYQGIWIPERFVAGSINVQRHFQALPTDIHVISFPKSGFTWVKALVFATITRSQHCFNCHPLHSLSPHECIPFLEEEARNLQGLSEISAVSEPRVLCTHLPFHMLPESVKSTSGCRIVYICREPKDTFLSMYHFVSKVRVDNAEKSDRKVALNDYLELLCDGISPYGSIWEHVLGYWNESLRAPQKILILKYEEMLEAPLENLIKLAEFMGCPFSEEEITRGVHQQIVNLCSFNSLKDLAIQQRRHIKHVDVPTTEAFYRKGSVGDWRNHMINPEMIRKLDQITREKLQGTNLTLGWLGTETISS